MLRLLSPAVLETSSPAVEEVRLEPGQICKRNATEVATLQSEAAKHPAKMLGLRIAGAALSVSLDTNREAYKGVANREKLIEANDKTIADFAKGDIDIQTFMDATKWAIEQTGPLLVSGERASGDVKYSDIGYRFLGISQGKTGFAARVANAIAGFLK